MHTHLKEYVTHELFHIKSSRVGTHVSHFLESITPLIGTYNVRKIPKFESLTPSGSRYMQIYIYIQIPLCGHYDFLFSLIIIVIYYSPSFLKNKT